MESTSYVSRVNQLDADLLDKEINKIIHEQLGNVYKELPPGVLSKYQPEVDGFLKSIIWFCSIQRNKTTFGQQILAISYQKDKLTRNRLIVHFLTTVCVPYVKEVGQLRLTNHLLIQKTISWVECLYKTFAVLNFFRFLKIGVCPSLIDYCLKWNHVSQNGSRRRNVGYAYMNRELIWTGFLELLSVTIPLINFHAMKRKIGGILKPTKAVQEQQSVKEPIINVNTKCAICLQRPSLPHHMKCVHIFCYFCLKSNVLADQNFQCPICDFSCKGDIFSVEINVK